MEKALEAARLAGTIIIESLDKLSFDDVNRKQENDFVTRVDRESENAIVDTLSDAFPDHNILAEEEHHGTETGGYRWIIDPLDGTANYIHGFPVFAVSIGLEHDGKMLLGVVYDPVRSEMFTAEDGQGAWLNGLPIHVSSRTWDDGCLIATGFPFRKKDLLDTYLEAFRRVFLRSGGIRRAGAAAIDLAYVAAGRCDGFFEFGLSPWDVAAGSILIREAGGVVTDFAGGDEHIRTGNVVAGNSHTHSGILADMKKVFDGIIDR
jgi:myo-inositol-1(or 4)-monophosphatase